MTLKECYARMNGSYEDAKLRLMMDSMVERFMFKFLEDDTMENLRSAVAERNIPDSFRAAHTLKGVAANLAFTELPGEGLCADGSAASPDGSGGCRTAGRGGEGICAGGRYHQCL